MSGIAFLGLGVMGFPMAGHLGNKGGHDVVVYNRTAAKAEAWVKRFGGASAATPREAAQGRDVVFACVGNDDEPPLHHARAAGRFRGHEPGFRLRRPHDGFGQRGARTLGRSRGAWDPLPRRSRVRRSGRGRERRADRDVRRRSGDLRPRRRLHRGLCQVLPSDGTFGKRAAHQDGEPDLHRGTGSGPFRGRPFRQEGRARRRGGPCRHLQGRRPVLADGKPRQDHGGTASSISDSRSTGCARISASASIRRARSGAHLPVTAVVDQYYSEVQVMGGKRWDTSSLVALLER